MKKSLTSLIPFVFLALFISQCGGGADLPYDVNQFDNDGVKKTDKDKEVCDINAFLTADCVDDVQKILDEMKKSQNPPQEEDEEEDDDATGSQLTVWPPN